MDSTPLRLTHHHSLTLHSTLEFHRPPSPCVTSPSLFPFPISRSPFPFSLLPLRSAHAPPPGPLRPWRPRQSLCARRLRAVVGHRVKGAGARFNSFIHSSVLPLVLFFRLSKLASCACVAIYFLVFRHPFSALPFFRPTSEPVAETEPAIVGPSSSSSAVFFLLTYMSCSHTRFIPATMRSQIQYLH